MATPTDGSQRSVDHESLRQFTESLVDGGVHGLFPVSSIGEFPSLTDTQNQRVVETVADAADGDATVMAGCGDTSVDGVLSHIEAADSAGADAGVVVSPYYLGTTQTGLERFFRVVADESSLPLLLYNIPQLTGNELSVDLLKSLAGHDSIVGVKDTSGDLTYHHRIVTETPEEFVVFQGATQLATASLEVGANGLIAGPANVFPGVMTTLYEAYSSDDLGAAQQLMREVVSPLVSATSDIPTAAATKYLVQLDRLDIGEPLPPLPRLTDDERHTLETTYQRVRERATTKTV